MAECDDKPWWRQWDGLPPVKPLPPESTLNGRLTRAGLRHPSRYGWGVGVVVGAAWAVMFRVVNGARMSTALLFGLGLGALFGFMQAQALKAQARRRGITDRS